MVSITEKDKKPEFICIARVKFKPARWCAYIYAHFIKAPITGFYTLQGSVNTEPLHYAYEVHERKLKWPFHEKKIKL